MRAPDFLLLERFDIICFEVPPTPESQVVQLWRYSDSPVTFNIGETADNSSGNSAWRSIWRLRPPTPVTFLAFSADGTLFATAGAQDRLVWSLWSTEY